MARQKLRIFPIRDKGPTRIKIGRQIERNQEEEGAENLYDAILEPVRESLSRRQAAYGEVVDELGDATHCL